MKMEKQNQSSMRMNNKISHELYSKDKSQYLTTLNIQDISKPKLRDMNNLRQILPVKRIVKGWKYNLIKGIKLYFLIWKH